MRIALFLVSSALFAQQITQTPNVGLQIPAYNTPSWQNSMNYNFKLIDSLFGSNSVSYLGTPIGAINGSNVNFTFVTAPAQIILLLDGLVMKPGLDYSYAAGAVTFLLRAPQTGDQIAGFGAVIGQNTLTLLSITGTIDGSNNTFTLSAPPGNLFLAKDGVFMVSGLDYNLTGTTVVFTTSAIPQTGDTLLAYGSQAAVAIQPGNAGQFAVYPSSGAQVGPHTIGLPDLSGFIYGSGTKVPTAASSITLGDCLIWGTFGITDAGAGCGLSSLPSGPEGQVLATPVVGSGSGTAALRNLVATDLTFLNGAANLAFLTPNGSSGTAVLRAITLPDLPAFTGSSVQVQKGNGAGKFTDAVPGTDFTPGGNYFASGTTILNSLYSTTPALPALVSNTFPNDAHSPNFGFMGFAQSNNPNTFSIDTVGLGGFCEAAVNGASCFGGNSFAFAGAGVTSAKVVGWEFDIAAPATPLAGSTGVLITLYGHSIAGPAIQIGGGSGGVNFGNGIDVENTTGAGLYSNSSSAMTALVQCGSSTYSLGCMFVDLNQQITFASADGSRAKIKTDSNNFLSFTPPSGGEVAILDSGGLNAKGALQLGSIYLNGATSGSASISSNSAAPSGACPNGSLFIETDANGKLWFCTSAAWTQVTIP